MNEKNIILILSMGIGLEIISNEGDGEFGGEKKTISVNQSSTGESER